MLCSSLGTLSTETVKLQFLSLDLQMASLYLTQGDMVKTQGDQHISFSQEIILRPTANVSKLGVTCSIISVPLILMAHATPAASLIYLFKS